jgi:hypothetical protein
MEHFRVVRSGLEIHEVPKGIRSATDHLRCELLWRLGSGNGPFCSADWLTHDEPVLAGVAEWYRCRDFLPVLIQR